ncbi:MAG: hypothetical protein AABY49_04245 [Planctomycetota bacterium]
MQNKLVWKELPLHQKIKYIAEIVAICVGIFLVGLNTYQLKLIREANKINLLYFKSSFLLDIDSKIINYEDTLPLILRLNISNIGKESFTLYSWLPKLFLPNSEMFEDGSKIINSSLNKQNKNTSTPFGNIRNGIILNIKENCIMEITINNDIVVNSKTNDTLRPTYIIFPITLKGKQYEENKTLIIRLARDKNKSLIMSSDLFESNDEKLLFIMQIERAQLGVAEWDALITKTKK